MKDIQLQSFDILEKYDNLLKIAEDEVNKALTNIQNYELETFQGGNGPWDDKIHFDYTTNFISKIQKSMMESLKNINDSRTELNSKIKKKYELFR